jgi:hypothetical protein
MKWSYENKEKINKLTEKRIADIKDSNVSVYLDKLLQLVDV